MITNNISFCLFACCVPVKGHKHSVIVDIQNGNYKHIPNLLYDIIKLNKNKTVERLKSYLKNEYNEGIDLYFNLLVKEGFGHYTNEPDLFPKIDLIWKTPHLITNAIIEFSSTNTTEDIEKKIYSETINHGGKYTEQGFGYRLAR